MDLSEGLGEGNPLGPGHHLTSVSSCIPQRGGSWGCPFRVTGPPLARPELLPTWEVSLLETTRTQL